MSEHTKHNRRIFTGVVVSTKMLKTLLVRVERTVMHPKYGKRYIRSHKYHVHYDGESGTYQAGDAVNFQECRPYSRTKRWRLLSRKA